VSEDCSMEGTPADGIHYDPLTGERLTKSLLSEFMWHEDMLNEIIGKFETIPVEQVQAKLALHLHPAEHHKTKIKD